MLSAFHGTAPFSKKALVKALSILAADNLKIAKFPNLNESLQAVQRVFIDANLQQANALEVLFRQLMAQATKDLGWNRKTQNLVICGMGTIPQLPHVGMIEAYQIAEAAFDDSYIPEDPSAKCTLMFICKAERIEYVSTEALWTLSFVANQKKQTKKKQGCFVQ